MQSFQLTVFILSLLLCISKGDDGNRLDDEDIDSDDDVRIVGGKNATKVPYQASLRNSAGQHVCGGTIIKKRTILTAAQCVKEANITRVVVGSNLLSSGGTSYIINRTVVHPSYNESTSANDIALLITKRKIKFNKKVKSISLPEENSRLRNGTVMIASGWGLTNASSTNNSNYLQVLKTRKITLQTCRDYWGDIILDTNICVREAPGRGLCMGDSGGPVVAKKKVQGIISFGEACALGAPDVLTRVASFVSWIESNWA